ncbi:hypothetical protein [Armatimonas sp.]|uniref:hypothetical protein n=1 Tax=Armatimonas sp. TaxID=1872638 RepID=UPI0037529FE5
MRRTKLIAAGGVLALGILGLAQFQFGPTTDGPRLWWYLRGSQVERVTLRWGAQRLEITDPAEVTQFYEAVKAAPPELPYETKCIPDKHPEKWSITLTRRGQPDFQVYIGVDGCCSLYPPEIGSTYSCQTVAPLLKQKLRLHSFTVTEAFR